MLDLPGGEVAGGFWGGLGETVLKNTKVDRVFVHGPTYGFGGPNGKFNKKGGWTVWDASTNKPKYNVMTHGIHELPNVLPYK